MEKNKLECAQLGINWQALSELAKVGGCVPYHLEGNALIHTCMVVEEMRKLRPNDPFAIKLAYLHDIGKIFTAVDKGGGNFMYPNHAPMGGKKEILNQFIPKTDPDFEALQWYITNHIKTLFWRSKGVSTTPNDNCDMALLRDLGIADIRGSQCDPSIQNDQDELVAYLQSLEWN